MNIWHITPEYGFFAKVGGLADALKGLSEALAKRGHCVHVICPDYHATALKQYGYVQESRQVIQIGSQKIRIRKGQILYQKGKQVLWVVEHKTYYQNRKGIYSIKGRSYLDNPRRFYFLGLVARALIAKEGQKGDIVHGHDWTAGLWMENFKNYDLHKILTIHNLRYQGIFPKKTLCKQTALKFRSSERHVSLLKRAILQADQLATVSQQYAKEIQTKAQGRTLAPLLRKRKIYGICNGIDSMVWDPSKDAYLVKNFSRTSIEGKLACKKYLQKKLKFSVDANIALYGVISRLVHQKGIDWLCKSLKRFLKQEGLQVVVLGEGDLRLKNQLTQLAKQYPNHFSMNVKYSESLAHQIQAASDFFIMPSRYEPCGLTQLYAMCYGTLPIVHPTGGLLETVKPYLSNRPSIRATGFYLKEGSAKGLFEGLQETFRLWQEDPKCIEKMRTYAMAHKSDWEVAAVQYERLYRRKKI